MSDKMRVILKVLGQFICPIVYGCDYRPPLFALFVRFIKNNI